jgi:hypothetical protein
VALATTYVFSNHLPVRTGKWLETGPVDEGLVGEVAR